MEKFRFLRWQVYRDAKELFHVILRIVRNLPNDLRYTIGPVNKSRFFLLNIAEGSGKDSDKELNRFFEIALGSCYELLASIDTLCVDDVIKDIDFQDIYHRLDQITNQLGGFKKSLK